MSLKSENKILGHLVDINKDACEFYEEAREEVHSEKLKRTFADLETLHRDVMTDIQSILIRNGGDAEADETLRGQIAQMWGELKAKVSNDFDSTIVGELEEAEDRCLHSMQDALNNTELSEPTRVRLEKDLGSLQRSHDYMKSLKEIVKAA